MTSHLADLDLDAVPGTVSVWFGRPGERPGYTRLPEEEHYAASLMKVPALVALHRQGGLDRTVRIVNDFASEVAGAARYQLRPDHDQDDEVWARLGGSATLGWLARRMIVRSSNLASTVVLEHIGVPAADQIWREVGTARSRVRRKLGDTAALRAGLENTVTAADLAALLTAIATDDAILEPLLAQERTEDLAAGLPPGTRVAHKNGWVRGVRHAAGIVFPEDAPPFVLAICATTPLAVNRPDDEACALLARIAAAAWADRG